ncbi:unnamed protein product [Arctia plantaginis]|uniref:Uncharacterized protein n=1 Tax=Arctia plantaginis TaxID=874455 RepID=A0A8S1B3A7_ARCPL|nr:unnamed protein product [Arctia plantaginis]
MDTTLLVFDYLAEGTAEHQFPLQRWYYCRQNVHRCRDLLPPLKKNEDIAEIKQVIKNKVKKRLAPPMNFMLRAVEPEGDDYYDKAQGDTDSDDYYEKKEWSDSSKSEAEDKEKTVNHTELSDIDGVVNIIVGKPKKVAGDPKEPKNELRKAIEKTPKPTSEKTKSGNVPNKAKLRKYEDDVDYEESDSEKVKPHSIDYEHENEAKKTGILDSVDELKERHSKEQKVINEKLKEEEMNIEEQERDKIKANIFSGEQDKYDDRRKEKIHKHLSEYDEYEDKADSSEEKHVVTRARLSSTTQLPIRTNKQRLRKDKQIETGKLSVFKNPKLFMIYDDDMDETSPIPLTTKLLRNSKNNQKVKYSASYTSTPSNMDENERISLLPADLDGKEGEPTLFFPKKRKNKKRNKGKTTYRPTDSTVAETGGTNQAKQVPTAVATDTTMETTDSTAANTIITDTTAVSGPTGTDVGLTATEPITDAVADSTDHKTEKKSENYDREKGGKKEYHSSHEEDNSEVGKKAYEGFHEETKTAKGHHEKEDHLGKYDDHGDLDKHHEEESGHYGSHAHEEHGKKHAKYEESGKHSKGHSTKGSHDIHKKEEYEKKVEFFEEEGDSAEDEKTGGYHQEKGHSEGGQYKKANYNAGDEEHSKGESGYTGHGGLLHVSKGHKASEGHDDHGKHGERSVAKGGRGAGKKWIYHHGYPAKTANLVRIDRRAEKYYHGPQYFG